MKIHATDFPGLYTVVPEFLEDERGFFAVVANGQLPKGGRYFIQMNIAFNKLRGTLRGMHMQDDPNAQAKLVRCVRGSINDVVVDIRPQSPKFCEAYSAFLTEDNRESLYVPPGFLHGYVTLEDNTEVQYQVTAPYAPESAVGFRWNDLKFRMSGSSYPGITWMVDPVVVSERDQSYPDFNLKP